MTLKLAETSVVRSRPTVPYRADLLVLPCITGTPSVVLVYVVVTILMLCWCVWQVLHSEHLLVAVVHWWHCVCVLCQVPDLPVLMTLKIIRSLRQLTLTGCTDVLSSRRSSRLSAALTMPSTLTPSSLLVLHEVKALHIDRAFCLFVIVAWQNIGAVLAILRLFFTTLLRNFIYVSLVMAASICW